MAEEFSIKITVKEQGGKVKTFDVNEIMDVTINPGKLAVLLAKHGSTYTYFALLHGSAIVLKERAKEKIDAIKVDLDKRFRLEASKQTPPEKLTENQLKSLVEGSDKYKKAMEALLDAREQEESLKGIREGLQGRLQAMIAIAKMQREERESLDPGGQVDSARRRGRE